MSKHRIQTSALRGQHFLTDGEVAEKIIAAAGLNADDTVLEIGPGLGVLTRGLLPLVGRLIAVELDPFFVQILKDEFADEKKFEVTEGDILKMRISDVIARAAKQSHEIATVPPLRGLAMTGGYKIVTNLPYNITSAFFRKFLTVPPHPTTLTAMIQHEVAERMTVKGPPLSMLALECQLYAECAYIAKVPGSAFAPPPKVSSAIVHLRLYGESEFQKKWGIEHGDVEDLLSLASVTFRDPRKKMSNTMGQVAEKCRAALAAIGESPDSRPAALSVESWVKFWKLMR